MTTSSPEQDRPSGRSIYRLPWHAIHPSLPCRQWITLLWLLLASLVPVGHVHAWDATGHRLGAYLAWEELNEDGRSFWLQTLEGHPRYQQDFINAMPNNIKRLPKSEQERWLFGQAAVWPDLARGFQGRAQQRFHRPDWHWIDGAWVRGEADVQGNVYLDAPSHRDIAGSHNIHHESGAVNVLTALELAHYQLTNEADPAVRAVALCWLLHLIGDIHQPLHAGGLVSSVLFPDGDRGGNAIRVDDGNLHSLWDRALRDRGLMTLFNELQPLLRQFDIVTEFRPERWLNESRAILQTDVYPDSVLNNIRRAERTGNRLGSITLSRRYHEQMQQIATQRIMAAGLRSAATLAALKDHRKPIENPRAY